MDWECESSDNSLTAPDNPIVTTNADPPGQVYIYIYIYLYIYIYIYIVFSPLSSSNFPVFVSASFGSRTTLKLSFPDLIPILARTDLYVSPLHVGARVPSVTVAVVAVVCARFNCVIYIHMSRPTTMPPQS
jgi:hypothetical protein